MTCREQALVFACEGEQLLGVISSPAPGVAASSIGVVIVVGGPQYRAGSHRQFVLLARSLAARGHHCLRFDYRGMGDSSGAARDFEQVDADIAAAVAALRSERPGLSKIALWGLCDGASAILLHLHSRGGPAGVDGLALLNPWVRSADSLAKTQVKHYYTKRLRQREFWLKLLRGGTGLRAVREFAANLRTAAGGKASPHGTQMPLSYQQRMAETWTAFAGPVLLLLSGEDYVAKEFLDHSRADTTWSGLLGRAGLERHDLAGVDHTFSSALWRGQAEHFTAQWLEQQLGGAPAAAPADGR